MSNPSPPPTNGDHDDAVAATTSSTGRSRVILDALPYVDVTHEEYEQYALALIEGEMKDETKTPTSTVPRTRSHALNFRNSAVLETEYQNIVQKRKRTNHGDHETKVSLVQGTVVTKPNDDNDASLVVWKDAVKRARIAYETERLRAITLQIEKDESTSSYKEYSSYQSILQSTLQSQVLEPQTQVIEQLNYQRQSHQQESIQPQLERLSRQYQELLHKRYQLCRAIQTQTEKEE